MSVRVISTPFLLVIEDFLTNVENDLILKEVKDLEGFFTDAGTGNVTKINKDFRSNKVAYYDEIYKGRRLESQLLSSFENRFDDQEFRETLSSCPYPLCDFTTTNYHETQVSRYGDDEQKYKWHIDRFENRARHITLVYYFFKEPKMFTGGEICFTTSPIYSGVKAIDCEDIKIEPKNNMLVVFSATQPHCVMPTKSSDNFEDGRFSANILVGYE